MTVPTEIVLAGRDVSVFFHDRKILDRLDFAFRDRCVTGILGASGCGKSTLLRTLCRMNDRVDGFRLEGEVNYKGRPAYAPEVDAVELRTQIGLIFQKPVVFPKSIWDNAILGLKHRSAVKKNAFPARVEQALIEVGLWDEVKDRLRQPAKQLSQGQQQRLALARALLLEPAVILLDEPTSSLDPHSTEVIETLIQNLKQRRAVILATHDLRQARRVCGDIVFMQSGKIVESAPADRLFECPERPETRRYLSAG